MKRTFFTVLLVACLTGSGFAQSEPKAAGLIEGVIQQAALSEQGKSKDPKLTGIIILLHTNYALLAVGPASWKREQVIMKQGDRCDDVEMLEISPASGSIKVNIQKETKVLRLHPEADANASAKGASVPDPAIQLQDADVSSLLRLYGEFVRRTVLHPALREMSFTENAAATNQAEAGTVLAKVFKDLGLSVIPDGKKFVIIVPNARAALAAPNSPASQGQAAEFFPVGTIDFRGASAFEVAKIYGDLVGRKLNETQKFPDDGGYVWLTTQTDLNKEELTYALDTVFRWNGIKMVPEGADMIKAVPITAK